MTIAQKVYTYLSTNGETSVSELLALEDFPNRTYLERILGQLLQEGKITKRRSGKSVYYRVSTTTLLFDDTVSLPNLHEDLVWTEIAKSLPKGTLSDQALTIFQFSFTEMLNNAIDHSRSGTAHIKAWLEDDYLKFTIRDFGIGIFKSIMSKKHLPTELDAIQELTKGKLTTAPLTHSGEGIFWTSKISDQMSFHSFNYALLIDNTRNDYAIKGSETSLLGTEVYFEVDAKTKKSMHDLFHAYSFDPEKTVLDTTVIKIKLYDNGDTWISRSQAKKVLNGLEKFKKITFDFAGIDLIGQGFADEIFRVFQIAHPDIQLLATNTNETVQLLINRAQADRTGRQE